jgi:hypothetical protein
LVLSKSVAAVLIRRACHAFATDHTEIRGHYFGAVKTRGGGGSLRVLVTLRHGIHGRYFGVTKVRGFGAHRACLSRFSTDLTEYTDTTFGFVIPAPVVLIAGACHAFIATDLTEYTDTTALLSKFGCWDAGSWLPV